MGQITHKRSYSKIYRTWIAMLSRCRNPKDPNYKNYGDRGIQVCDSWHKFENFLEDMGDLPFYEAQIDRIDNELGYFKENCKWSTAKENSRNRRSTKRIGNTVQIELIEKIGWSKDQFRWYVNKNGISWVLENFKNGTLPERKNVTIDREDIVGIKFGKWEVIKFDSYTKKTGHLYLCRCDCDREKIIQRNNLMKGKTTACRSCAATDMWKRLKVNKNL